MQLHEIKEKLELLYEEKVKGIVIQPRARWHEYGERSTTPFAVHYEKIRIHLREKATNSAKIHSLARKSKHLRINQIQLRFFEF